MSGSTPLLGCQLLPPLSQTCDAYSCRHICKQMLIFTVVFSKMSFYYLKLLKTATTATVIMAMVVVMLYLLLLCYVMYTGTTLTIPDFKIS